MYRNVSTLVVAALGCAGFITTVARAQNYPDRPVRILVAGPPGSSNDITVRAMAQRFTQAWGQQMVLDNRPGGAGILAHEITVRANPDGYTLLFSSSSGLVLNPLLFKMPYDPFRDLAPVSLGSINPQLLFANPSLAAKSVPELIALAKAKPGTLNCASAGNGTPNHLGCELLKSLGNINFVHVPYKGSGPGVVDVVAGQAHFMFASIPQVLPLVRTGKLRALGVGSLKRTSEPSLIGLKSSLQRKEETEPLLQFWNAPAANFARCSPRKVPRNIVNLNRERSEAFTQRSRRVVKAYKITGGPVNFD